MDMGTLLHSSTGRQKTLVTIYGEPPRATAQQKGVDTRCGYPRFYKKARQREEEKKKVYGLNCDLDDLLDFLSEEPDD
jgi:hypothetical protein